MDLLFYRNKISKFEKEYQKPYFQRLKMLIFILVFHLILIGIMIAFIVSLSLSMIIPIAVFVLYSVFAFYNYVKIYRANLICKEEFYRLIASIVRDYLEMDLESLKDYPRYRQVIKDTRLVNRYDAVGVYKIFRFTRGAITGLVIDVNATRTQGNNTVTILKGLVYVYDMENSTNMQIRNDPYKGAKCLKERDLSSNTYSVYSFDEQKGFHYSPTHLQKFSRIDSISPQGKTAIDFQPNQTAVYVKRKNTLAIPREMSDFNISGCCAELISIVDLGRDIGDILNRY